MMEFYLLYKMSKRLAEIVKEKGRSPVGFVVLLIAFWFLGEMIGGVFGAALSVYVFHHEEPSIFLIWPFGMLNAAFGAFCAFQIAKHVSPA